MLLARSNLPQRRHSILEIALMPGKVDGRGIGRPGATDRSPDTVPNQHFRIFRPRLGKRHWQVQPQGEAQPWSAAPACYAGGQ